MSKSATEQYQIKRKRKHNNNKQSNNIAHKNGNGNGNNKKRRSLTSPNGIVKKSAKLSVNVFDTPLVSAENSQEYLPQIPQISQIAHLDEKQIEVAEYPFRQGFFVLSPVELELLRVPHLANETSSHTEASAEESRAELSCITAARYLRDKLQVAAATEMPLSQCFKAKSTLASTKRNGKSMKLCARAEAKRKAIASENFVYGQNGNECSNGNSNGNGNGNGYGYLTTAATNESSPPPTVPTAVGPTANAMESGILKEPALAQLQQTLLNNNLQFSYLLAESLARYGRLKEAFDVYAFIASEQLDGCIPLDRLNTLAASVIVYVRQFCSRFSEGSGNGSANAIAAPSAVNGVVETASGAAAACNAKGDIFPLEIAPKSQFVKKHSSTDWNMAASGIATISPQIPAPVLDSATLDLHASSREMSFLPSPTPADERDPLLCPLCNDILRCPVTTNCGHTFCRQCCETITMCNICHIKFPKSTLDEFVGDPTTAAYAAKCGLPLLTATASSSSSSSSSSSGLLFSSSTSSSGSLPPLTSTSMTRVNRTSSPFLGNISNAANQGNSLLWRRHFNAHLNQVPTRPNPGHGPSDGSVSGRASNLSIPQLQLIVSPSTVTTATVASTTSTTTTTMASRSSGTGCMALGVGTADNMKFMPDVLVRRLVEKWWGTDLQAKKINETATSYMHLNLLDDALKHCNASLEKSPTNFKSLLLRAEVLRKLNHFQSSLADVDNAIKNRSTSSKAHYMRSLALCGLSRFDEALYHNCLAISLDKSTNLTSSEIFQHDLAKNFQKLLAQTPKNKSADMYRDYPYGVPYSMRPERNARHKQMSMLNQGHGYHLSPFDDDFIAYEKQCDIIADEDIFSGSDYLKSCDFYSSGIEKGYDGINVRRQASRKHFRRKWLSKETELMPASPLIDTRCSTLFHNILDRTQQEVQRLKKLESSGEASHKPMLEVPANLIDASDFDCVLCCRTFWKPVVTPCGHTYCLVCLDRCMDYTSSCPLCMSPLVEPNVNMYQGSSSPVPFILAKRPVTKFLEAAMKRFIPESYQKRLRQETDMEPSVPVFICTTAFPYVACPLFVYEPRYRLMVRRAVESGEKQFGIVQPHSGKSRYFDVGTILDIRDCVMFGNGCSILSTIGCKRFKILARNEKDGYETAKVEYIYDETISDENVKFVTNMHAAVLTKSIEWFESLDADLKQEILQSFGEMPAVEENWQSIADGPAWAWWMIALLPLNQQLKVNILATTSLEKRLRAIEKTLDRLTGTFRRPQQSCSVGVVQQQQHQQQHHENQQPQCDNELAQACQTDECCQRTSTALATSGETHTATSEYSHLML